MKVVGYTSLDIDLDQGSTKYFSMWTLESDLGKLTKVGFDVNPVFMCAQQLSNSVTKYVVTTDNLIKNCEAITRLGMKQNEII